MNRSGWTTIRVRSISERPLVIRALFDLGAEGVEELDTEVVTHMRSVDRGAVADALRSADPGAEAEFAELPDTDWTLAWRSQLTARRVGTLVVTPPWLADHYAEAERIVIDPGMAFGTGDHETTRGVLRLLPGAMHAGDVVADLGAGSAVLAIAAARLGARHAYAIEIDPDAIENAQGNVDRNKASSAVTVMLGDAYELLPLLAPVNLVLANIVAPVLVGLLPLIAESLASGGRAILSGILTTESADVLRAAEDGGWRVTATDEEGSWWSAAIVRA